MMQNILKAGRPALIAGAAGLALILTAACGGGDNGDGGASTPAPTPAPATAAPTQAPPPAPATAAPATEAPAPVVPAGAGETITGSENLFISASETGSVTVDLLAGDVLQVTFDVESNIVGGQNVSAGIGKATEGIQLVIQDPLETSLHVIDETTDQATVTVQAEVDGPHEIIFFNPFPLQAETVIVDYVINP